MGVGDIEYGDLLYKSDVMNLHNSHTHHIYVSVGCRNNDFSLASISKEFLKNTTGGGIAFIGSSTSFGYGPNHTFGNFCNHVYYDVDANLNHLGDAFTIGFQPSTIEPRHRRRFNLLGDPALEVWGKAPNVIPLSVTTNLPSLVTGPNNLSFTIHNLPDGINARYCVSKENEIYVVDYVLSTGGSIDVQLDPEEIKPESIGEVTIMVTAKNYVPVKIELDVSPNPNANLFISSFDIFDNISSSTGNNDGIVDAGETFDLELTLQNSGNNPSGAISNSTIVLDPNTVAIQIINNSSNFPNINPNDTGLSNPPFKVKVDNYHPDLYKRKFVLDIPLGIGNQSDFFFVTPHAPIFSIYSTEITTNLPNNNLENEAIVYLTITLKNSGSGTAFPGIATLTASGSQTPNLITFINSTSTYDAIPAYSYGSQNTSFEFQLNSDWNNGPLIFNLNLTPNPQIGISWNSDDINLDKPPQILNLIGEGFSDRIKLSWDTCSRCAGYNVYRSNTSLSGYQKINSLIIPHYAYYEDINLQPITTYYYKVSGISESGVEGPLSDFVEVNTTLPIHEGWPKTVNSSVGTSTEGSPITEDVDNDLMKEVFLTIRGVNSGAILGFRENGDEYVEFDHNTTETGGFYHFINSAGDAGAEATSTPSIADVDNDGKNEVIVTTSKGDNVDYQEKIFVFSTSELDSYGYPVIEKSKFIYRDFKGPVLAGIETDNPDQIAQKSDWGSGFNLLNSSSATLSNYVDPLTQAEWPVTFSDQCPGGAGLPVIADLDGDGFKEYIIGIDKHPGGQYCTQPTQAGIYIFKNDKTSFKPGTPINQPFYYHDDHRMDSPPVVADIDNNGTPEILCVSAEDIYNNEIFGHVFILQTNGECHPNWEYDDNRHRVELTIEGGITAFLPALSVSDVDDDGYLEIFIADKDYIYAWNHDGSVLNHFPIYVPGLECRFISPLLCDIDGVTDPVTHKQDIEVIVASNSDSISAQGIHAYKISTGQKIPGWPLKCGKVKATPCIDDVDMDGKNEIIASSAEIVYMWDTEGKANYVLWGKFRLNNYNNAVYTEPCIYLPGNEEITGDVTYYDDIIKQKDIIIKENATLTVRGTLYMPATAGITVECSTNPEVNGGGKLIIDGGKITTKCEGFWLGVELYGDPAYSQSDRTPSGDLIQGEVKIINGGAILNAEIGILASKRSSEDDDRLYGYTGGHVFADGAYFVNNKIAVQLDPYPNFPNCSMFRDCRFLTTGELLDGSGAHDYFVKLLGVHTIPFLGCTFKNTRRDSEVHYSNRGTGIFTENSDFYVNSVCLEPVHPCSNYQPTTFERLTRGIYAMNSGESTGLYMTQAEFLDNYQGVYLSGFTELANALIHSNKFRNYPYSIWSYGLYLNECSGYHVEDNEFYEVSQSPMTVGLIVNESGPLPNEIYRNRFYDLKLATLSQNINRNADPGLGGLCYKCNKFIKDDLSGGTNRVDFTITFDGDPTNKGIAHHQGIYVSQNNYSAIGNMFDPSPESSHYDFYNEGTFIQYYFTDESVNQSLFRTEPWPNDLYKYGLLGKEPKYDYFYPEEYCPSTIESGGSRDGMEHATEQSELLSNELSALVDGGSTLALNLDVATSIPPEALQTRDELLSESPYLSDTVMKTSITKDEVLDNAMIRDVLVANPQSAKSDQIINMLEDRTVPMPDYMMAQILEGEDTISSKEILESKRAYWEGEKAKEYQRLLRHYKGDSINPPTEDSLAWLFAYRNSPGAYYDWATWHHKHRRFNQQDSILNLIPSMFSLTYSQQSTHQAYFDLFEINSQLMVDSSIVFNVDSLKQIVLQNIVLNNNDFPGAYARNILIAAGKITYQEPIILPDTSLKSKKRDRYRGVKLPFEINILKVYPNPAHDYFVVEYHWESAPNYGFIHMYDIAGKEVGSFSITGKQNQVIIPTKKLQSGVYLLILEINGKKLDSVKISIIR